MGLTVNQLRLIRAIAENRTIEIKDYALACLAEDTTQKNHYQVEKYKKKLIDLYYIIAKNMNQDYNVVQFIILV